MQEELDKTFSLQSFQLSEEEKSQDSLLSVIIEKEAPQVKRLPNEIDHYYQQLGLSFYSQNIAFDKKAPRSLNDERSFTDRQKAKTESSKIIYQQLTLSNGISESTAMGSQHQVTVQSNSNDTIVRKEQKSLKAPFKQEEITFYTPDFEDKILVLKQPPETIKTYSKKLPEKESPSLPPPKKLLQQEIPQKTKERMVGNCYFTQKTKAPQPKNKFLGQVVQKLNLSVLRQLIDQNMNAQTPASSQNSFYFTKRSKASPDSPRSVASNISARSNTSTRLLNLLRSPYLSNKKSPQKVKPSKKIQNIQQNCQQQYLEKQLEEIRKFQANEALKNKIKTDYGLETRITPRDFPKQAKTQIQSNLDKQLIKLLKKPK